MNCPDSRHFSAVDAVMNRLGEDAIRISRDEDFPMAGLVTRDGRTLLLVRAGQSEEQIEHAARWALRSLDARLAHGSAPVGTAPRLLRESSL